MTESNLRAETVAHFRRLLASGDQRQAEQVLRNAVLNTPNWPEVWVELAKLLAHVGRTVEAIEILRAMVSSHPDEKNGWLLSATLRFNTGDTQTASVHAKRAILLRPGDYQSHAVLNQISTAINSPEVSIGLLSRMLVLSPDSFDALLVRAKHIFAMRRSWLNVLHHLRKASILAPNNAEAWFVRGLVNLDQHDVRISRSYLGRAAMIAPGNAACAYQLSRVAFLLDEQSDAESAARAAIRLGHPEKEARFFLARILRASDRVEEANREFDRVEQIDPDAPRKRRTVEWTATSRDFLV